jgi:signal transduction histidine kinase
MRLRPPRHLLPSRSFDALLAAALLLACEAELVAHLLDHHESRPLLAVLAVAAMTVPIAWRRQAPLAVACVATGAVVLLALALPDFNAVQSPTFVLFIPPYTVAAYEPRPRALAGLAVCLAAPCLLNALHPAGSGSWAFAVGMCGASWTTGRVLHARRTLAAELRDTARRIAAERDGRSRLAVADERTRIARELNAVVARSVSAMVVQSETAQRLLDLDGARADAAMAALEDTGREALAEMRRILGVLRRIDDEAELAPQPGVGQIPALVERAREERRHVVLHVEGEPGPLPASVDLGMYRVLHDALADARGADAAHPIEVALRFGELDVTLEVTSRRATSLAWPTPAMRERVALCDGEVEVDAEPDAGARMAVRMPRAFDGALS